MPQLPKNENHFASRLAGTGPNEAGNNNQRSEEVRQFMTRKPDSFARLSPVIFLTILTSLILSLFFIQYPVIIKGEARLMETNAGYLARISLPEHDLWKVKKGQKVQLHLDAYPDQEFGILEGPVSFISPAISDSGFYVLAELSAAGMTGQKKPIPLRPGLHAQAWIILRNDKLINRLLESTRH